MLHRSKSKERAPIGGPSYMDNNQVASYLQDLRQNRPQRPAGARPSPFAPRLPRDPTIQSRENFIHEPQAAQSPRDEMPVMNGSSLSHTRSKSATPTFLGRPLVRAPSRAASPAPTTHTNVTISTNSPQPVQYMPDGRRWMEKQEAVSLRRALEDMDLAEDHRIHRAAQDEASELVWKHQNPEAPFRYRDHLRKGSYIRSHSQGARSISGGSRVGDSIVRDAASGRRSASGGSASSNSQPASREPSDASLVAKDELVSMPEKQQDKPVDQISREETEDATKISFAASIFNNTRRRSSGGSARKPSGSSIKGIFSNPNDKIYEEPEVSSPKEPSPSPIKPSPIPERRNPFARLRSTRSNISIPARSNTAPLPDTKKLDKFEIQRNPPTQSRDPGYVENEPLFSLNATAKLPPPGESDEDLVKMKDGKEVRSVDLRAATSKRLSDRSANLPTPVLVSDKPGRPIVSFKEQKHVAMKEEIATTPADKPTPLAVQSPNMSEAILPTPSATRTSINVPSSFASPHQKAPPVHVSRRKPRPSVEIVNKSSLPIFNLPDSPTVPEVASSTPSIPSISVEHAPRPVPVISIAESQAPPIPVIAVQEAPSISTASPQSTPSISVSAPAIPTISVSEGAPPTPPPNRPLPMPTKKGSHSPARPQPRPTQHAKHMSLAGPPRTSVLCTSCALPIAGRIVSAAGSRFHPECFRCHHCAEALECVAFFPEPDNARAQRIDRIRRRLDNEPVKVHENSTDEEDRLAEERDGWTEDARFFCHLDFHEFFSPRCKSCKTPIEGEVVVACGAHWHAGHFFCAQCGDPFDASTPFVEKDGYAWCVNCHTNRYSTKCKKCRKPVIDTVVKALGAEWHEQCFCCVECGGRFEDGRYFLRRGGNGQDPVCVRCEDRRLKA